MNRLNGIDLSVQIKIRKNVKIDVKNTLIWLNSIKPDVFLPQCLHTHYIAATMAGRQGMPWVSTIHSDDPDYWYIVNVLKPWENNGYMVSVSNFITSEIKKNYDVKTISTIPCGTKITENRTSWNPIKFRIIYLGRIVETQKRISKVIEVMVNACQKDDKIECFVIGEGIEKSKSVYTVNHLKLQDRIFFTGAIEKDEIEKYLSNSQAIILMSDYEGLPVAIMEAMSFGVVPIVRNIQSGINELVKNNETGIIVDDNIVNASNALVDLCNNKDKWEFISNGTFTFIKENFNSETMFKNYMDVVNSIGSWNGKNVFYRSDNLNLKDSRIQGYFKNNVNFKKLVKKIIRNIFE
jgi:glycosyltransferase involved in cell wall biosynthesis